MSLTMIWVNCPDQTTASSLGLGLIKARLAPCMNILPMSASAYVWQGELCYAEEVALILKTRTELYEAVAAFIEERHPYDTPSIICADVAKAADAYEAWVYAETKDPI